MRTLVHSKKCNVYELVMYVHEERKLSRKHIL